MLKQMFTWSSLLLLSYAAIAKETTLPSTQSMQQSLSKAIPEIQVESVKAAPINNFYEVTSGPNVFYVSNDLRYILYGELLELHGDQITNLTEVTRQEFVKKALAKIDPKTFIVFPATTDKKIATITIGTDIDCGYCTKLHQEIPALNAAGITVRYLAFPRTPPGTSSYEKSAAIWCAKDPKQTINDAFAGKPVTQDATCQHPLAEHYAFVRDIGANATPIIILENGLVLPGYMPAKDIIGLVNAQK
jgi:thiol:disulfide interchange protein DsbC